MARHKRKHSNEFKVMIVELLQSGQSVQQVSLEYDLDGSMIRKWRKFYESTSGNFSTVRNPLSPEELEVKSLKKELRELKLERDILKKAVSIFSKSDH